MKKLIVLSILGVLLMTAGCVSFPRQTYNTQKLATDTVAGAVHGYNLYLATATNSVTGADLANMLVMRQKIYDDVIRFAIIDKTVSAARLAYQDNSADTNKTMLTVLLGTLTDNANSIMVTVQTLIKGK